MRVEFIIDGEPQGKARHRTTKQGVTYTPAKTVDYERWIKTCYISRFGQLELKGPLRVAITAYYGVAKSHRGKARERRLRGLQRPTKRPDVDNVSKAILDSLNKLAYHDDSYVVDLKISKFFSETPRVEVIIEEIEEEK